MLIEKEKELIELKSMRGKYGNSNIQLGGKALYYQKCNEEIGEKRVVGEKKKEHICNEIEQL